MDEGSEISPQFLTFIPYHHQSKPVFASTRHTGQPESYYHGEGRVALTGDKPAFQYKLTDPLLWISFSLVLSCTQNQGSIKHQQLYEDRITESSKKEIDMSLEIVDIPLKFGCTPCSIEILVDFDRNFNTLSDELISLFFCTFDKSCNINVEHSQYSNDLIFKFLDTYPELLLSSLKQMSSDSSKLEYIIQTFEDPISDVYDIDRLIVSLEEINDYPNLKLKIIKSLKNVN